MSTFAVNIKLDNNEATISNEDIMELNIIEDIYDFCMSGNITFVDRVGWIEKLENLGAFIPLGILWQEGDNTPTEKTFQVFSTEVILEENQLVPIRKIKWYFFEPMFSTLTNRKYSLAWGSSIKGSDIIRNVSKNILGLETFAEFEETQETFDNFFAPYWTVAEIIKWVKKRCSGANSRQSGYLFYNNSLGTNFTTVGSLLVSTKREMDGSSPVKYTFSNQGGSSSKVLGWLLYPPEAVDIPDLAGEKIHGFDPATNKLLVRDYSYTEQFETNDKGTALNLFGNATSFPNINTTNASVAVECESDPIKINNKHNYEFITKYLPQLTAWVIVRGESTRYAGMIIDTEWKSADSKELTDKQLEGLWLVKSITHQFVPFGTPSYKQLLVCVKPGPNKIENGSEYKPSKDTIVQTKPSVSKP